MRDGHNDTAKFDEPSAQDVFNWVPPVFASLTKRESLFAKAEDKNHLFNKENAGFQSFAEPQDESSFGGRLETHNALSSVPEYKDTNSLDLNP